MKAVLLPLFLCVLFMLPSCSGNSKRKEGSLSRYKVNMRLEDKSGIFLMKRESSLSKNQKHLVTKYSVSPEGGDKDKTLEQSIVIATPGTLKGKVKVLRPLQSQYKVWFDGKLYQTETKVDVKKRSLLISMVSPERQWQGRKSVAFPGGNGVFCYFSQLVECVKYTGFIEKAISNKQGKLSLTVIWDGYPYIQEQYLNIRNEPFAQATFEYDGTTKEGDDRFSMNVSGSVIFYLFNEDYEYAKIFWPAQGFSLYHQ